MPYFRARYTCVTFDHRGFGRSLDPRPVAEQPGFDEDLVALIDHLDLPDLPLLHVALGAGFRRDNPNSAFLYQQILDLKPPSRQPFDGSRYGVTAEQAAGIKVPVLFIEGEDDINIPPAVIRIAQALIPGARLEMVPDAGHAAQNRQRAADSTNSASSQVNAVRGCSA